MKKIYTLAGLMLALLVLSGNLLAQSYTLQLSDVYFNASKGKIRYLKTIGERDIIIPESFIVEGKTIAVKEIGAHAFFNKQLTKVSIPSSVTNIGEAAFHYNKLTSISLPESITNIDSAAFSSNKLTTVIIPGNIKSIGVEAFSWNKLGTLKIPNSVKTIGRYAFRHNKLGTLKIPNSVKTIGRGAFEYNNLKTLTIPNSVTNIGAYAFQYNKLNSVNIPNSLSCLNDKVFNGNRLNEIIIPNSVTSIGAYAFANNELNSVSIPNSVTLIKGGAFNNNSIKSLNGLPSKGIIYARNNNGTEDKNCIVSYGGTHRTIDFIPNTVTIISKNAFMGNHLESVNIPSSVSYIGASAFQYNELTSITLPKSLTFLGDSSFYKNKLSSIAIPNTLKEIGVRTFCSNKIKSVTIPPSITYIGDYAFQTNKLTSLTMPPSITYIGDYAFQTNKLTSLTMSNSVTEIGKFAFYNNDLTTAPTLSKALISIGLQAFEWNSIGSINLPVHPNLASYGWTDSDDKKYKAGEKVTDLWVAYTIKDAYSISYDLNGGKNDSQNPIAYHKTKGVESFKPAIKAGYALEGWYTDNTYTKKIHSIAAGTTKNIKLWAKFVKAIPHQITYVLNGGVNADANPTSFYEHEGVTDFATPTKQFYSFEGWYSDADFTTEITEIAIGTKTDITLYAKFTPIAHNIAYKLNGGTNAETNPTSFYEHEGFTSLQEATKEYYSFEGWYSDADFTTKVTEIAIGTQTDITLYAKFSPIAHSISYELNGGINAETNPVSFTEHEGVTNFEEATKEYYSFEGWYNDAEFTTKVTEIAVGTNTDITLYAKFVPIFHSISYELNDGTNASTNPATFNEHEGVASLEAASKEYYSFEGWFSDADFTTKLTEIAIGTQTDVKLYAKFSPIPHDITYVLNGGTNADANPAAFNEHEGVTSFEAASKEENEFTGWYSDEALTTKVVSIAVGTTTDITLYAGWKSTTGVEDIANSSIKIYPTVVSDIVYVKSADKEIAKLSLLNTNGQVVLNREVNASCDELAVSHLAKGIYFVKLELRSGEALVRKIVVQ